MSPRLMPENRYALTLQLAGAPEPMLIEIGESLAAELPEQLPAKLLAGQVETITGANGTQIAVNFHHVVAAHVDTAPPLGRVHGSPDRRAA